MSASRAAAAKLFGMGFQGTEPTPFFRDVLADGISAAVLFAQNLPDAGRAAEVTAAVKAAAGRPVLLCVDQEGGRVARLRGNFTAIPPMRTLGATGNVSLARDAGVVLGRELRATGFDVNFAPVMDVDTNPVNPVIADRSFGRTPELVSDMGVALLTAMQRQGVAACAKHFPGHGDTSQDSHKDLPRLAHDLSRLEAVELVPFQAAIRAGVASIMSAHVMFPAVDPLYPATMSERALGGIVRGRFGFEGVVFSDDMEMKAVADHFALEDQLLRGLEAGIDLFLICHSPDVQRRAIDLVAAAIDRGTVTTARISASHRRIDALMSAYCRPPSTESLAAVQAGHRAESARLTALPSIPVTGAPAPDPTNDK